MVGRWLLVWVSLVMDTSSGGRLLSFRDLLHLRIKWVGGFFSIFLKVGKVYDENMRGSLVVLVNKSFELTGWDGMG